MFLVSYSPKYTVQTWTSLVLTENPQNLTMKFHKPELMEMHHWFSKECSESTQGKTCGTDQSSPSLLRRHAKANTAAKSREGASKEIGVALPFELEVPDHLQEKGQHLAMEDTSAIQRDVSSLPTGSAVNWWEVCCRTHRVHRSIAGPYQFKQYKVNNTFPFLKHFYEYCQKSCKLSIFRINFRPCNSKNVVSWEISLN